MTALTALANFVCLVLILVLQYLYNDHLRTQIRKELYVALDGWRIQSQQLSNYVRFTAMAAENKPLSFPPFPEEKLDWGPWFDAQLKKSNVFTIRVKNAAGKWETISYLSMVIMGYRWDTNINMWPANIADIAKLDAASIILHTPTATAEEQAFLLEDEKLFHFADARTHRLMQATLREALLQAFHGHSLFPEIDTFDKSIGPLDLYQGSRLLAKITEISYLQLRRAKGILLPEAMNIPVDIQANPDISKLEMHDQVTRLEKYVQALTLGGHKDAETEMLEHVYELLHDHPRPIVGTIVKAAEAAGPTIHALRAAVLKYMPFDSSHSRPDASAHLTSTPPEPSLMERTCTAMMSFLSASKPPDPSPSRAKTFTTEQQTAYIERLKAKTKAQGQTIKGLQQALSSRDGLSDSGRGRRGGKGGSSGGGRGRGRGRAAADVTPEVDLAEGGEIFLAHMAASVETDLALEDDLLSAPSPVAAKPAAPIEPESSDDEHPEPESSADEYPETPAPSDPPIEEPPIFSHPEGPPPPPAARGTWSKGFLVFLIVLCGLLNMAVLAWFAGLLPPLVLPQHIFGSSSEHALGWIFGLLPLLASRRFWPFHPLYLVGALSLLLVGYCRAEVPTLDLQVPGGPPVSLLGFDSFRPSPLVSPGMHDFLHHESTAFMVSQGHFATAGDPSKFSCKWCNDSGANRSLTSDITAFTSNYRAVNINLTVAKQNISMQAVGIGDCLVHCLDNMGRPCKLEIKNVLHVPTASRSLLSSSSLAEQGYQTVLPSVHATFPPGLYFPRRARSPLVPGSGQQPRYIPFETLNGLYFLSTRNDTGPAPPNTRANEVIIYSRKLGHCPLQTLWDTRKVVTGLESLADSHFPRNYVSGDVRIGKSTAADIPSSTLTVPSRPNEIWHMDTVGPTKTTSVHGYRYNTSFTCGYSGYVLSYGHASPSQIPELQERWYADIARFRELHGDPRVFRCDNASVNVSRRATSFRVAKGIRTETICPSESHQAGTAERMNRTLVTGARTVLLASGLERRWWHHAVLYQTFLQNIRYSSITRSSPHLLMYGTKPDVSHFQEFGVEGWLHRRIDQRQDTKFDARGESVIFVGYPPNQQGFLLWCPGRGPTKLVSSNNVVFGTRCPRSSRSPVELVDEVNTEIPLPSAPAALTLKEVHSAIDLHIVGTFEGNFVLSDSHLDGLRSLSPSSLPKVLYYTHMQGLSAVHLALADSYEYYTATVPAQIFAQEVTVSNSLIPKTVQQALSPSFVDEWGPAIDKENAGFQKYDCFAAVPLPSGAHLLPGLWVFTRKRDNSAKARFCVGGHRQLLGRDYFPNKNYCAVLSSRDNRILLALAASEGYMVYQTDVVQAFLHGKLDDVDIYINPPARYPCPSGCVLKLLRAIYGLHQAPVKFKQEVIVWFKDNGHSPANDAQTIWVKREKTGVIIHALYADDFLHFTNNKTLYQDFQKQFKKRFDVKTGSVGVYLGNRISVDQAKLTVDLNQTEYVMELLERFNMSDCIPVSTPIVQRLSVQNAGDKLSVQEHEQYRNMVGSLLYLACWSRPDIAFSVSELSRFISSPGQMHMQAVKHLLRYLKGTCDLGLKYSKPTNSGIVDRPNVLWGFVDSDWAGCPDSRRSTSGYTLMLNGAAVSWKSKRQSVVALSTAEAEFIAASSMVQEVIYARRLLEKLGFPQAEPTPIYEDNSTCIKWAGGAVGGSDRAKHIDLREHFVHEAQNNKVLQLLPINSTDNVADLLTKPLLKASFLPLRKRLMGF
jgi:hypothetical protein